MSIPHFQAIMPRLLRFANDKREHSTKEAMKVLSHSFNLTEEEKNRTYRRRKASIFHNRFHWALSYLKHAGLLTGTNRGSFKITRRGGRVLEQNPENITEKYLYQFQEFKEFKTIKNLKNKL